MAPTDDFSGNSTAMHGNDRITTALVVAVAENGLIGRAGDLPWRMPSDLKLFRKLTLGKPMIMGRRTYNSIGKPLDGRDTIVLTRTVPDFPDQVLVAADYDEAVQIAERCAAKREAREIAVIGGRQLFEHALVNAGRIYLTRIHAAPAGDVFFPRLNGADWRELSRTPLDTGPNDDHEATFIVLERRTHAIAG